MRPHTEQLPKSLLPVQGRPFAEVQLEWLARAGITDVVYCVGYLGGMVRAALGDGTRFGARIQYSDEGDEPRGTAGALRVARDSGLLPDTFFVLNGDSYLNLDFAAAESARQASGLPVLMTVFRNMNRWDRSNAILENGRVRYDKRTSGNDEKVEWIDYGLSILSKQIVEQYVPGVGATDLADVMSSLSHEGLVAGFEATERFFEVGSPDGLRDLERHLAR